MKRIMNNRPKRKQVVAPDWEDNDDIREQLQEIIENSHKYTNKKNDKVTILQLAKELTGDERLKRNDVVNDRYWQEFYRLYLDMHTKHHNPEKYKRIKSKRGTISDDPISFTE